MNFTLKNKIALVTGGAKRVGQEIALTLARRGADIALHYRTSRREALRTRSEIARLGVRCEIFQADISKTADVKKMVRAALKTFGRIDLLVNNAAVFKRTPFPRVSDRDWDFHLDTNLKGCFLTAREMAPHMLRRKSGVIVNIADWAGMRPYVNYLPYCVSKAGVICLTQALAKSLAPHVRVNAVAPGPVLMSEGISRKDKANIIRATPLKRIGSPRDVAEAVAFLAEGAGFTTGHTLTVDGGRLIS